MPRLLTERQGWWVEAAINAFIIFAAFGLAFWPFLYLTDVKKEAEACAQAGGVEIERGHICIRSDVIITTR